MVLRTFLLGVMLLFIFQSYSQKTEAVRVKSVNNISYDDLRKFGYSNASPATAVDNKNKQPISTIDDAAKFLQNLLNQKPNFISNPIIKGWVDDYVADREHAQRKKIIVFVQHPLDLSKLYGDTNSASKAKGRFTELCHLAELHSAMLDDLVKARSDIKYCIENKDSCLDCAFGKTAPKAECDKRDLAEKKNAFLIEKINRYSEIENLIKTEYDLIAKFTSERDSIEKVYNSYLPQFVEKESMETYFLNKEKDDWSNYALDKKDVLFVVLGGAHDFANYKIKIENRPNHLQSGLNDLKDLATSILGELPFKDATDCDNPRTTLRNLEIPVSFILLNDDEIKNPSTIKFTDTKDSARFSFDLHEKTYFGIKVGVSAANLDMKQFTINSSNQLTVKLDSTQQKQWKSNLVALLELYPFGRDIDRLDPIWSKDQKTNLLQRLGIMAGLRISKDPIQDLYGGISLALSRDFSLGFGLQYHSEPKDVANLPVGVNATLDYLKGNVAREYKTEAFFGILINPAVVSKLLGFKKQ